MPTPRLTVVGGGNMARAIVQGALRAHVLPPNAWRVVEPDPERRSAFDALSVHALSSVSELKGLIEPGEQILLAIKPQALDALAKEFAGIDLKDRVVISILAGTPTERVRQVLGGAVRVVRVMPNLAAQVGEGATAVSLGAGAKPGDDDLATRLFAAVGPMVEPMGEGLLDAFTAVAGSGPAYVYFLAETMIDAAVKMGIDAPTAERAVVQTLKGAVALVSSTRMSPQELRKAVTSKGGTTEAALGVLEREGVREAIVRALIAARDRGAELAARSPD